MATDPSVINLFAGGPHNAVLACSRYLEARLPAVLPVWVAADTYQVGPGPEAVAPPRTWVNASVSHNDTVTELPRVHVYLMAITELIDMNDLVYEMVFTAGVEWELFVREHRDLAAAERASHAYAEAIIGLILVDRYAGTDNVEIALETIQTRFSDEYTAREDSAGRPRIRGLVEFQARTVFCPQPAPLVDASELDPLADIDLTVTRVGPDTYPL
jgi:hypothetical protein